MNNYSQELGYFSTTRRLVLRIKAVDIANELGCSRQSFYNFEAGNNMLSIDLLPKLCNILQINIDDFIFMRKNLSDYVFNEKFEQEQVSKNLRFIRKSNNMTQDELSIKLDCNKKTIHKYENNSLPTITYIHSFSSFFNIKPSFILYEDVYEDRLKKYLKL